MYVTVNQSAFLKIIINFVILSGAIILKTLYVCTVLDGICVADVNARFSSGELDKSLPV